MTSHATAAVRAMAAERSLIGATLLARPDIVTHLIPDPQSMPPTWPVRVLGGRLLGQGLLQLLRPERGVVLAGATVDTMHALSMIGAAAQCPGYRRLAIASAAEATTAAGLAAVLTRLLP